MNHTTTTVSPTFAVTGVTGHVGGATARALLSRGADVRAVVRSSSAAATWAHRGATPVIADFTDHVALTAALRGCAGAFVMLPTIATAVDPDAEHRALADSIAAAVAASGVGHLVVLSSYGAELADGTGPIRWLHYFEKRLASTGAIVTAIRAPHFQEKFEELLPATAEGVFPVFADGADVPTPMVATNDIGAVAAERLIANPTTSEIIDLDAPHYTERQVAEQLGVVLGRPLEVLTIPRHAWEPALVDAGLPPAFAVELAGLYDADQRCVLQPGGGRAVRCTTPLADTIQAVVGATADVAS